MRNSGHTIGNARWEAGNVRDVLNYYSAAPERLFGRQIPVPGGVDITFKEPLGVVGVIVPWNFPMPIAGWGLAPALAAGNTVVLKPAELTPLTALCLAELALAAGLPRERADRATRARERSSASGLCSHRRRAQGGFYRVDRGGQAGHGRLRRPGEAGDTRARGQERQHRVRRRRHRASRRHRSHERVRQCRARTAALARGSWSSVACTTISSNCSSPRSKPYALRTHRSTRAKWALSSAHSTGTGSPLTFPTRPALRSGAGARAAAGYWYPPTVLAPIDVEDRAFREEIFGPVVAVAPFDDEADAIRIANSTEYGLSALSGHATSAAPCGWPGASRPATFRSILTRRSGTGHPLAGSSSPGSGASWGRTLPTPSARSRTFLYPRRE